MVKILMVLTSSGLEGCGGEGHAGFFLSELVHPYNIIIAAGHEVVVASTKGGGCHCAAASLGEPYYDAECKAFWENPATKELTQTTKPLSDFNGKDFKVIFFVGGFGTMSDFPTSEAVATVGKDVYESGGIVAAVCHGPSALINIKLSDGTYLVQGKTLTAFTNEEEGQVNLPLPGKSCQDALSERGATFVTSPAWSSHVQSSDRVMTGQNPGSAGALGEAIVAAIA